MNESIDAAGCGVDGNWTPARTFRVRLANLPADFRWPTAGEDAEVPSVAAPTIVRTFAGVARDASR
ncbi:MAG: hypothetical protein IPK15_23635 [Verrucomicrobia bacterium]|nr:hypothetical protein [Verrucomicrobiota bacterium]